MGVTPQWNCLFPVQQMAQITDLMYSGVKQGPETRQVGTVVFHVWLFFAGLFDSVGI